MSNYDIIRSVFLNLVKECNSKTKDFEKYIAEKEEFLEELFLESQKKIQYNTCTEILPKTPAVKSKQRKGKLPVVSPLVIEEEENAKENSGGRRAASKAAQNKIKESSRLLNDLSSKLRRPDGSPDKSTHTTLGQNKRKSRSDEAESASGNEVTTEKSEEVNLKVTTDETDSSEQSVKSPVRKRSKLSDESEQKKDENTEEMVECEAQKVVDFDVKKERVSVPVKDSNKELQNKDDSSVPKLREEPVSVEPQTSELKESGKDMNNDNSLHSDSNETINMSTNEEPADVPNPVADQLNKTPVVCLTRTPVTCPTQTTVERPTKTPVERPTKTPLERPTKTPLEPQTPVERLTQTPVERLTQTPVVCLTPMKFNVTKGTPKTLTPIPAKRSTVSKAHSEVVEESKKRPVEADAPLSESPQSNSSDSKKRKVEKTIESSFEEEKPESEESDESSESEEEEEEKEIVVEQPRRITRSKVRQQQEALPVPAPRTVLPSTKTKSVFTNQGKFSPKPYAKSSVKQLAAAYTDHIKPPTTPSRDRKLVQRPQITPSGDRGRTLTKTTLSRVSSASRLTPLNTQRVKALMGTAVRSSSTGAHQNRTVSRTASFKHKNIVTGVHSFLPNVVQTAKPTREEVEEQKQENLRKKIEREEEAGRKKEELTKSKAIEAKRKNEERMRKVHEAKLANERKVVAEKEKREAMEKQRRQKEENEKRQRIERQKEEEKKKRQMIEEKRRMEEERRRMEEEKRKMEEEELKRRKIEADEKRRQEDLRQIEERRRQEERRQEEKRRQVEAEKLRILKQKRDEERRAREEEELRRMKEREMQRALAATKQMNVTYDAPKTPQGGKSDSYDMTPVVEPNPNCYGLDDLKSDDESDDDCAPRKPIPRWAASRKELSGALQRQELYPPIIEAIFPKTSLFLIVDLESIFKVEKKRYKVRSSSAQWRTPPHLIFSQPKRP